MLGILPSHKGESTVGEGQLGAVVGDQRASPRNPTAPLH
jgi:hypothetical protein